MNGTTLSLLSGIIALVILPAAASAQDISLQLNKENMSISFEVDAPWNIMDGTAENIEGTLTMPATAKADSLRANVAVDKLDYSAGLRAAGQLVAAWLRDNEPTPAKFSINKSSFLCTLKTVTADSPCKGVVDGQLTIWGQEHTIDIPIEVTKEEHGLLLTGAKEIKWGEYGFGDPDSTISNLHPVVELTFSIQLPEH